MKMLLFLNLLLLAGCATSTKDVTEVGENKYTVSSVGNSFASADRVFESALEEGKKYCSQRGKKFELLDSQGSTSVGGTSIGSTNYVGSNAEQRIFFTCK